jgi:hypothetical protein
MESTYTFSMWSAFISVTFWLYQLSEGGPVGKCIFVSFCMPRMSFQNWVCSAYMLYIEGINLALLLFFPNFEQLNLHCRHSIVNEWPSDTELVASSNASLIQWLEQSWNRDNKKTPWPEFASKPYRPSDRRMWAKIVPTFADRGCHMVSVTDPYGRILGFYPGEQR